MLTRVCCVTYLNSAPLVWGLLHGPQRDAFPLRFEIPSVCAALLQSGDAEIGLVPVIELERQELEIVVPLGIASSGAVRSILLLSKMPLTEIRTLVADTSSRTSVVLTRIWLAEKFGMRPRIVEAPPDLQSMLQLGDACLIIGDPALRVNVSTGDLQVHDLGAEWTAWSGLPMVYAVWAARAGYARQSDAAVLRESWEFGRGCIDRIAALEHRGRGISQDLARAYLTRHIEFELGDPHMAGLALFRRLSRSANLV